LLAKVPVGFAGNLNVCTTIVDATGQRVDPDSCIARVYSVDLVGGGLTLLVQLVLAQLDGQVGYWGAPLDISDYPVGVYHVLFVAVIGGITSVLSDTFVVGIEGGVGAPTITVRPGPQVNLNGPA